MAKTVRWHGSAKLQLQPELKIVERADSITTTISYRGPYAECVAKKPAIGQAITGFLGFIDGVDLAREDGTIGTITVTIKQGVGEGIPAGTNNAEVTWELHWEKIQKPLLAHPRYTNLNTGYGNPAFGDSTTQTTWGTFHDFPETATVADVIQEVLKKDTVAEREELLSDGISDNIDLVRDYLAKLGKGIESYNAYTPVITKRTSAPKRPTATGAGFLLSAGTNPGGPLIASIPNASSYRWYKDGDDVTKTGSKSTYERTEVWLAVDDVDADLYKGA